MKVLNITRLDRQGGVDYEVVIESAAGKMVMVFHGTEVPPGYDLIWQRFNDKDQVWDAIT